MATSAALRSRDYRNIIYLIQDCRDLGDDPIAWRTHLAQTAAKMVGAGAANVAEHTLGRNGPMVQAGIVEWGLQNGFRRDAWESLIAELMRCGLAFNPMMEPYFQKMATDNGTCLTRADLVPDAAWYRSRYYRDYHGQVGADAIMYCYFGALDKSDWVSEMTFARPVKEADFSPRHRKLVREIHSVIFPLLGGPLAGFQEASPRSLPPRVRAVLRCLLEGDSDKQVAARLDISPYTVNQYAKQIYSHFNVTSRSELLARWVRRGWAKGFHWADPEE